MRSWFLPLTACLLVLAGPARVGAQGFVPEIPLTAHFGVGARSMGMGGTGVAAANDFSALHYNPAALGVIRQTELHLTMARRGLDTEAQQTGVGLATTELNNLRLNSLGFVLPLRTYRGSLVFGAGIFRSRILDREINRQVPGGNEFELEKGGPINWSGGLAVMVAPNLILGGQLAVLSGSDDREITQRANGARVSIIDDTSLTGWTASLGMLFSANRNLRIGATLDLPERYQLDGVQTRIERPVSGEETQEAFSFEDDLTLPYSFGLGAAFRTEHLLVTADTHYTDWREIDFSGPLRLDERDAYRATTAIHVGVEGYLPNAPVRLRAGYQREPLPYELLPDFAGDSSQTIPARFDEEADYWSVGAGLLIADALNVDLAFARGGYQRSTADYSEEVRESRLLVTASYRPQLGFPAEDDRTR